MVKSTILLVACVMVGVSATATPQDAGASDSPKRHTVTAVRLGVEEKVALDGRLDEPVWSRTIPATDFVQQVPRTGAQPTQRTEVRIAYSNEALYMGVTCFDSEPDKLLRNTMKRDDFLRADDRFMWVMDPFLDGQSGYFFETNPSGLMGDSLMNATGAVNREWDGIWNEAVHRSEIGWTIEIEIPFRTLNFNPTGQALERQLHSQRAPREREQPLEWVGPGPGPLPSAERRTAAWHF